jgi:hypothetical protein
MHGHFVCQYSSGTAAPPSLSPPHITGVYTASEMTELLEQWDSADGEAIFVVSDRLAFFITGNPSYFYSAMTTHNKELVSWLARLGGTTFTDYGGACIDRRCLRRQMIRAVASTRGRNDEEEAVRAKILRALQTTDIRTVN